MNTIEYNCTMYIPYLYEVIKLKEYAHQESQGYLCFLRLDEHTD